MLTFAVLLIGGGPRQTSASGELNKIINYREYSDLLASSGQPNQQQLQEIKDAGFERIVFLAFSDHEESLPNEDRIVKELGMDYVHIPIEWEAPTISDFRAFAAAMNSAPDRKTLVHCQVNFRASAFSFLYRVLYGDVPIDQAKDALDSVWVPNRTWRNLMFRVLEENGVSPHCDACLWDTD